MQNLKQKCVSFSRCPLWYTPSIGYPRTSPIFDVSNAINVRTKVFVFLSTLHCWICFYGSLKTLFLFVFDGTNSNDLCMAGLRFGLANSGDDSVVIDHPAHQIGSRFGSWRISRDSVIYSVAERIRFLDTLWTEGGQRICNFGSLCPKRVANHCVVDNQFGKMRKMLKKCRKCTQNADGTRKAH